MLHIVNTRFDSGTRFHPMFSSDPSADKRVRLLDLLANSSIICLYPGLRSVDSLF
jgi:hypothetical protein